MKAAEWKTYRTRFLVHAKQLDSSLSFTDSLGRQHSGQKGDYLVESADGLLRIAPRQIFEDIYVPMAPVEAVLDDAKNGYATQQRPTSSAENTPSLSRIARDSGPVWAS
jgi:hypothetical protein